MRKRNALQVAGLLLGLLMVTASPSHTQTLGTISLMSPNEESGGFFGTSVADAGDVNQDGFPDVIVGSFDSPGTSPFGAGRAYVFSGQDGSLLFQLMSPNENPNESGYFRGSFGNSVSGAGDVNQDGFADVIVGALGEDIGYFEDGGRAYVFSGQDGSLLFQLMSPNPRLEGLFGSSVSGAGDVNHDGFADVIVGAAEDYGTTTIRAGRAYIFSGQDGSLLFQLVSPNEEYLGLFGWSVCGTGDVNQDGFVDVIVGAYKEDTATNPAAGRAYVFSGQDGSLLFQLTSPNEEPVGFFGSSVSGAGDANLDGFADVIVGAPNENPGTSPPEAGRAYVFSGQDGSLLFQLISRNEEHNGYFGSSVSGAGDVNLDGFADVIVGAHGEDPGTSPDDAGRAYLFSGPNGSLLCQLKSPNEEQFGFFGWSVSGAGDINQDGLPDVIVGAPLEDPGTSPQDAGRAYVFVSRGVQPNLFRINSGGPNYTDTDGRLFVADQAYATGSFGYVGGSARTVSQPISGTEDDPLYQDLRLVRDGSFSYRFDVPSAARYKVTLYLMAPALEGAGNIVMDVQAEAEVVFDDLDVTAQAGGAYRALTKTFTVNVNDGTLDLQFLAVNNAAVVSAIAVVEQTGGLSSMKQGRAGAHRW